jgi:cytochrome P450
MEGNSAMNDLSKFSLADKETASCPFNYYEAMRAQDPVHFDEKAQCYIVSSYADIMDALGKPLIFSSALGFEKQQRGEFNDEIEAFYNSRGVPAMKSIVVADPPYHTRIRSLMDKAFTAHRVASMEAYITQVASELLDPLLDKGKLEFMSEFAIPFPIYIIADQLGVPRDKFKTFRRWSDATVEPLGRMLSRERALWCAEQTVEMWDYIKETAAERRITPADDMITDLVQARIDDPENPELNEEELFHVVRAFIVAGNETTTTAISNGMLLLARDPGLVQQMHEQIDDDRAFSRFAEEVLRLESPVQGLPRITTQDVELGGKTIPEGALVILSYASGNRDTTKFECPERFDHTRKNVGQHLAFGGGIHRCIGAMLARMEIKVAMRAILKRMQDIQLDMPDDEIAYVPSMLVRTLTNLPITFASR